MSRSTKKGLGQIIDLLREIAFRLRMENHARHFGEFPLERLHVYIAFIMEARN